MLFSINFSSPQAFHISSLRLSLYFKPSWSSPIAHVNLILYPCSVSPCYFAASKNESARAKTSSVHFSPFSIVLLSWFSPLPTRNCINHNAERWKKFTHGFNCKHWNFWLTVNIRKSPRDRMKPQKGNLETRMKKFFILSNYDYWMGL